MSSQLDEQKIGVVLFDDTEECTNGWACLNGSTSFPINGVEDLSTNAVWISNANLGSLIKLGLSSSPRLRSEAFLRTKLSTIILELGLTRKTPQEKCKMLALIVGNTMKYALLDKGILSVPASSLATGVRAKLSIPTQPLAADAIKAADSAIQPFVICHKYADEVNNSLVALYFHRLEHALRVTSFNLPKGRFEQAPLSIRTAPNGTKLEYIRSETRPLLLNIEITKAERYASKIINHGSGAGYRAKGSNHQKYLGLNAHHWVTDHEFSAIEEYCDIQINDILVGEGWARSPSIMPSWKGKAQHSYSFGLYAENLWVAATRDFEGKSWRTPQSAWVHSIDRMLCFEKARELQIMEGLNIHSYGYGRIMVVANEKVRQNIHEFALKFNMITHFSVSPVKVSPPANPTLSNVFETAAKAGSQNFIMKSEQVSLERSIEEKMRLQSSNYNILSM